MNEFNFIAENKTYKVYSIYESVYLKEKKTTDSQNDFSKTDKLIAHHYGDPEDGIITENHIIVSGCGISIYDLKTGIEKHILNDADNITWTNGIHQDGEDDYHTEFRFVTRNAENKWRVFKMHIPTEKHKELD